MIDDVISVAFITNLLISDVEIANCTDSPVFKIIVDNNILKSIKNKFISIYDLFANVNICVVITPSTVVVKRIKLYGNLMLLHAFANSNDFK